MKFHTIQVDLEPDHDPEMVGQEYRAIVMKHTDRIVCDTGCVVRADSPLRAFIFCKNQWEKHKGKLLIG
jgi:hypothetical protein